MKCKICNKKLEACIKEHEHGVGEVMPFLHCPQCGLLYWWENTLEPKKEKPGELQELDRFLLDIHAKCIASVVTESKVHGYDDFIDAIMLFRKHIAYQVVKEKRDAKREG